MEANYQEAIKTIPCFDKDRLTVGSCVHVLEIDSESEEIIELFGLIKQVELDELVILYFEGKNSVSAMKHKRISIQSVIEQTCSIEVLQSQHHEQRTNLLKEKMKKEHSLAKIPFPHLSL